jgi:hypothetical protein
MLIFLREKVVVKSLHKRSPTRMLNDFIGTIQAIFLLANINFEFSTICLKTVLLGPLRNINSCGNVQKRRQEPLHNLGLEPGQSTCVSKKCKIKKGMQKVETGAVMCLSVRVRISDLVTRN